MSGVGASVRDTRVRSWPRDQMRSNEQHDSSEAVQAIMGLRRELMGVCLALCRLCLYFLIRVYGRDCIASHSQLRGNLLLALAIPGELLATLYPSDQKRQDAASTERSALFSVPYAMFRTLVEREGFTLLPVAPA